MMLVRWARRWIRRQPTTTAPGRAAQPTPSRQALTRHRHLADAHHRAGGWRYDGWTVR